MAIGDNSMFDPRQSMITQGSPISNPVSRGPGMPGTPPQQPQPQQQPSYAMNNGYGGMSGVGAGNGSSYNPKHYQDSGARYAAWVAAGSPTHDMYGNELDVRGGNMNYTFDDQARDRGFTPPPSTGVPGVTNPQSPGGGIGTLGNPGGGYLGDPNLRSSITGDPNLRSGTLYGDPRMGQSGMGGINRSPTPPVSTPASNGMAWPGMPSGTNNKGTPMAGQTAQAIGATNPQIGTAAPDPVVIQNPQNQPALQAGAQPPPAGYQPVTYQDYLNSLPTSSESGSKYDGAVPESQWNAMSTADKLKNIHGGGGKILNPGSPEYSEFAQKTGAEPGRNILMVPGTFDPAKNRLPDGRPFLVDPSKIVQGDGWFAYAPNNMTPDAQKRGGMSDLQWGIFVASMFAGGAYLGGAGAFGNVATDAAVGGGFGTGALGAGGTGAGFAGAGGAYGAGGVAGGGVTGGGSDTFVGPHQPYDIPGPMEQVPATTINGPTSNFSPPPGYAGGGSSNTLGNIMDNPLARAGVSSGVNSLLGGGGGVGRGTAPNTSNNSGLGDLIQSGVNLYNDNKDVNGYRSDVNNLISRGDYNSEYRPGYLAKLNDMEQHPENYLNDPAYKAMKSKNLGDLDRVLNAKGFSFSGNEQGALADQIDALDYKHINDQKNSLRQDAQLGSPDKMAIAGIGSLAQLYQMKANRNAAANGTVGQALKSLFGNSAPAVKNAIESLKQNNPGMTDEQVKDYIQNQTGATYDDDQWKSVMDDINASNASDYQQQVDDVLGWLGFL